MWCCTRAINPAVAELPCCYFISSGTETRSPTLPKRMYTWPATLEAARIIRRVCYIGCHDRATARLLPFTYTGARRPLTAAPYHLHTHALPVHHHPLCHNSAQPCPPKGSIRSMLRPAAPPAPPGRTLQEPRPSRVPALPTLKYACILPFSRPSRFLDIRTTIIIIPSLLDAKSPVHPRFRATVSGKPSLAPVIRFCVSFKSTFAHPQLSASSASRRFSIGPSTYLLLS